MKKFECYLNIIASIIIVLLISACNEDRMINKVLKYSGRNRIELEKVLEHYKNDPEKQKAAKFLIKNMSDHYSFYGNEIEDFYCDAEKILSMDITPEQQHDKILYDSRTKYKVIQEKIDELEVISKEGISKKKKWEKKISSYIWI